MASLPPCRAEKGDTGMSVHEGAVTETRWRKKKMDLANAYQAAEPDCLYCGICIVDVITPEAVVFYSFLAAP
jgi:hypothetical protein